MTSDHVEDFKDALDKEDVPYLVVVPTGNSNYRIVDNLDKFRILDLHGEEWRLEPVFLGVITKHLKGDR